MIVSTAYIILESNGRGQSVWVCWLFILLPLAQMKLYTVLILVIRHFRTLDMKQLIAIFPFDFLKRVCFVSGFVPSCTVLVSHLPPSSCSRTHLPAFPHMFWQRGWSVRIVLFIFEWQCAMSNRWSCTKPANPEARGNSLMWWNLKAEGSGMRPKVIPHYH